MMANALEATAEMCAFCFRTVEAHLGKLPLPRAPESIPNDHAPIFVCYKRLNGELRGCIGNFAAAPLHQQLSAYALTAALEDTRFEPISIRELPNLKCTVSLLHSFEPAKAWDDWVVGTHGIRIEFRPDGDRRYGATFLPSVAREQGWDHLTTLDHLVRKAGHKRGATKELLSSETFRVERYQESQCCTAFKEIGR